MQPSGIFFNTLGFLLVLGTLAGCGGLHIEPEQQPDKPGDTVYFELKKKDKVMDFASPEKIGRLSAVQDSRENYQLGPGDIMDITVWRRPEISREGIVVAPDGIIAMPRVGIMNAGGRTVAEITQSITEILARNYERPEVTVTVRKFNNNKAFVLGRVSEPGVVHFPGDGTLLEALALAGGLPHIGKDTFLTKCAIIRGRDTVIWIDLRELLDNGNMSLNARIQNNDVIFIPEAEDEVVMVLGEVSKPGPVQLKRGLNLVDAVMHAGGYTHDADMSQVFIIRQDGEKGYIREIDMQVMLEKADFRENFALSRDDIVYVSPTGIKSFNYSIEQLLPSLKVLSLSAITLQKLGLTNGSSSSD